MRRRLGLLLLGFGTFTLLLAYLLPFQVYPRLAILPLDPAVKQVAHGTGFNVMLPRSVEDGGTKVYRNVGVTSTVYADAAPEAAAEAGKDDAVWQVATRTFVDGHGELQTTVSRISLDRHTSLANNCCEDTLITKAGDPHGVPVKHEGYVFTFPFQAKRQDYPIWDETAGRTYPAHFVDQEQRRGYTTYRFEQDVPDQKIGTQALPGDLYGLKANEVTADYHYKTHRTYWIEPQSGAIVDYREQMDRRFVHDGKVLPVIQGTVNLVPPAPGSQMVKLLDSASKGLPLLRWQLPKLLLPLGVLLILAGLVVEYRRHRAAQNAAWDDEWDDGAAEEFGEDREDDLARA